MELVVAEVPQQALTQFAIQSGYPVLPTNLVFLENPLFEIYVVGFGYFGGAWVQVQGWRTF